MSSQNYRVIGTRPTRADAVDKVTGRAIFGPDIKLPGLLWGKVLRSPHAHARIISIDTSKATAFPGVLAVVTGKDLPVNSSESSTDTDLKYMRDNILASDKVLYEGHPVAAVAAVSPQVAEDATRLIRVNYELLPPVMDLHEAMKDGAPKLHESMRLNSMGPDNGRPGNIASHIQFKLGDPAKGFSEADAIVEHEYITAMVHQCYIEPHAATAQWNHNGTLTIWASTQGHFVVREETAKILRFPLSKIRVIPTEVGGAFGGKCRCYLEPVAAILSRKAGRPVKMVMMQSEVLLATGPTPGSATHIKMGATRAGRITSATAEIYFEAGAYPGSPMSLAAGLTLAGYNVPNGQIDGYEVVVNKPHVSDYRAPGDTQVTFAVEQAVDELAQQIGMDPLEFRLLNAAEEGSHSISGISHHQIGAKEVLVAAKARCHNPLNGEHRGRGVAFGYWGNWGGRSSCTISVNADGSVALVTGSVDLTGTRLTSAMQAAEVLGLSVDQVSSRVGDTDSVGYTDPTGGSRTTFATGLAVIQASQDVLKQMSARAAVLWNVPPDSVSFGGSAFVTSKDPARRLTFSELAAQLSSPVTGKGNVDAQGWGTGFGCHIVDVEVDPETGKVVVLRYTAVQDVGKAIHPGLVEGQIQGGVAQGIGWALWEGYFYDNQGKLLNPNMLDYKLPTALDLPRIETVLVEVPGPSHPFGVRGIAEVPIVPPPAAVANAIARAIGSRVYQLPITPEQILHATGVT